MKHIGISNERKVAVAFRNLPNEPTQCLVVYYEELPQTMKDSFMLCLEGAEAQAAPNLSDVLHKFTVPNGDKLLGALHMGSFLEKVATDKVTLTPNAQSSLLLRDLNNILDGAGGAVGNTPEPVASMPARDINADGTITPTGIEASANTALTDEAIAADLRSQAANLQAEANRLLDEANDLVPAPAKKRGRPAKVTSPVEA